MNALAMARTLSMTNGIAPEVTFTDEEIDTQLTRLVAMLEPLMLIFMAIIVAVMLMSIYLPLIQMYGGQSGDL